MPISKNITGDILKSDLQTVVCPVNVVGVMGKGLALEMAKEYPGLLAAYKNVCRTEELTIENIWLYKVNSRRYVLCFPTKIHWRNPSQIEWIDNNLALLADKYETLGIKSLAMPRIGCGLGGLNWELDIRPLVYKHLDKLPIPIVVYGP